MKGDPGRHLSGIGLMFNNGLATPFCEPQVYSNIITPGFIYRLNPSKPYNRIFAKVANSGDNTIITGIRIGTDDNS